MYWLDGILLVGIGIGALLGARSGFLQQVSRVVGLTVAFYTAFLVNDWCAGALLEYVLRGTEEYVARFLGFLLVFFGIYLAIFYGARLIQQFIRAINLDSVDRLLGAIVGALKMTLFMAFVCLGLTNFPHPKSQEVIAQSVVAPALVAGLELVVRAIPSYYKEQFQNGVATIQQSLTPPREAKGPEDKRKM
jgi:membrane protein required for colicin V production